MKQFILIALACIFVGAGSSPGAAEEGGPRGTVRLLDDRWEFTLSGGLVDIGSDVAAGRTLGALIDLEEILGFDETITVWGFDGLYRFSATGPHAIRLSYGNYDRSASKVIEGTVPIFDLSFRGALRSTFTNQVATLTYQYSFINHHRTEAGATIGLGFYKYGLGISGEAEITGEFERTEFRNENVDIIAPVPSAGFFINHGLTPDLILELRTSFISLNIGEHFGRIINTWGGITWYFTDHFGVGINLSLTDVTYDNHSSRGDRIKVSLQQASALATLNLVF